MKLNFSLLRSRPVASMNFSYLGSVRPNVAPSTNPRSGSAESSISAPLMFAFAAFSTTVAGMPFTAMILRNRADEPRRRRPQHQLLLVERVTDAAGHSPALGQRVVRLQEQAAPRVANLPARLDHHQVVGRADDRIESGRVAVVGAV